jgi:hypothetical protein
MVMLQDDDEAFSSLRKAEGIGRPLGTADFVIELERRLGRPIARRAPGSKATATPEGEQLKLLQEVSCHRITPGNCLRVMNSWSAAGRKPV